ncbi:MAG: hypothetical protein ACKVPX_01465 [Myxococcaceae bacterium]
MHRVLAGLSLFLCGTTLVQESVYDLTQRSEAVVRGRVVQKKTVFSEDGARLFTHVDVEVAEVWHGKAQSVVRIVQPGGVLEDFAQRVDGVAAFTVGEDVVVFLERGAPQSYRVTGMAQGKYRVVKDAKGLKVLPESLGASTLVSKSRVQPVKPVEEQSLEALRAQVRAVTSRP